MWIGVLKWCIIAAQEQIIFAKAWCTLSGMETISRWFILNWNVGTWRVWVLLGWINPGDFLIPPTMNLGSLHCICGKGIYKYHIIDGYRLPTCHYHHQNTQKSCLGNVFCANDNACHVINTGLISPQISSFHSNQLLTGFVSILRLVYIYITRQIELFKRLM